MISKSNLCMHHLDCKIYAEVLLAVCKAVLDALFALVCSWKLRNIDLCTKRSYIFFFGFISVLLLKYFQKVLRRCSSSFSMSTTIWCFNNHRLSTLTFLLSLDFFFCNGLNFFVQKNVYFLVILPKLSFVFFFLRCLIQ